MNEAKEWVGKERNRSKARIRIRRGKAENALSRFLYGGNVMNAKTKSLFGYIFPALGGLFVVEDLTAEAKPRDYYLMALLKDGEDCAVLQTYNWSGGAAPVNGRM